MLVGGFVYGPIMIACYLVIQPGYIRMIQKWLPKFGRDLISNKFKFAMTSTVIDLLIVNWPYLAMIVFSASFLEENGDIVYCYQQMKDKLVSTWIANIKFWGWALPFIYGVVPFAWRSAVDAVFGAVWGCILSYVYHK